MEKSESITELTKALVQIQSQLKPAVKDKTNPFLKSKYADLSGVWDSCKELLKDQKLAVVQMTNIDSNGGGILETFLFHESGEWIGGKYPLKPIKNDDPQALGSALTYARRYALAAMLGIVTEDDDAEGSMNRQPETKKAEPKQIRDPAIPVKKLATAQQLTQLEGFKNKGHNIKVKTDSYGWNITKMSDLSYEQAERLIKEFSEGK